ncbi:MAG: peptidylprolyl isomerase [Pseudomonadota bacterium]
MERLSVVASTALLLLFAPMVAQAAEDETPAASKFVTIETNKGAFTIELYPEKAPQTVQNFLEYVEAGHYDRSIFHRVIDGFVAQGGGYSKYFNERPTRDPVPYEGNNGLSNVRGTIAMARTRDPNSATAQWYVNLRDNTRLDHVSNDLGERPGYTVFGHVVDGLPVVDAIGATKTGSGGPFPSDVPLEPIVIDTVKVSDAPKAQKDG